MLNNAYKSLIAITRLAVIFAALIGTLQIALVEKALAQATGDLLMTTYPNQTFSGTPITTGPVTVIDQTNLNPGGRGNDFSVRIEGFIQADTTGIYTFETRGDDGVRLFVNGSLVVNDYTDHGARNRTGTISLTGGVWYPILVEHYENGGRQRLRLRWQTPTSAGLSFPPATALSQKEPVVSSEGPPLGTQDDRLAYIITEEAARSLRADILANQRSNQDARARHAAAMRCHGLREDDTNVDRSDCQDGITSRNAVPLTFDGVLSRTDKATKLDSSFYKESPARNGYRYVYFGDVDVSRFEGGDVSATFAGRFSLERMSGDRLIGYFLGVSATHSDIKYIVNGKRTGYGVSAGIYAVDQLTKNLTWDGFLSVGTGRNNLDIRDGGADIAGNYTTTSLLMGLALSSAKEFAKFELRPEVNMSFGHTDIGEVELTGGTSPIVDAGGVTLGRLSVEPEFVIPLRNSRSRFDTKELWITPSLTCEYQDTTYTSESCGAGLAIEWSAGRSDDLLGMSFRAATETIGDNTRDSIGFRIESVF